jgi:hypothetical protein
MRKKNLCNHVSILRVLFFEHPIYKRQGRAAGTNNVSRSNKPADRRLLSVFAAAGLDFNLNQLRFSAHVAYNFAASRAEAVPIF